MFRFLNYVGNQNRRTNQQLVLIVIFFIFGLFLAVSSIDILPFVAIHESGHILTAKLKDIQIEKTDSNTAIMYLEPGHLLKDYIQVMKAGYNWEIGVWYVLIFFIFILNFFRIRKVKAGIHYPVALLPGYGAGIFMKIKGTTDFRVASELLKVPEDVLIRQFIFESSLIILSILIGYILFFGLLHRFIALREAGVQSIRIRIDKHSKNIQVHRQI